MTTDQLHQPLTPSVPLAAHEHGWVVESAHHTSQGRLLYVRCTGCGVRRVDLQDQGDRPPSAISRPTRGLAALGQ
ncbi:hypothetical protein [Ruania alba]|uniref:Uncharacterized protein n=1 Tax=Ruania alba TaxID=648782 RepID=A0A1H5D2M3_9MICO|nr:hypothetical protein [Ruania alba]SED72998.1 hypothetical protein SAMN04488554_0546 [Ruania alba]